MIERQLNDLVTPNSFSLPPRTRYLDVLDDTMMVRRLPPHRPNMGKRLVKSPKVYLRDSGVLHALLGLATVKDLQGHPVAGASWEGFVVEQVAAQLPPDARLSFYRTAAGAEIDLVIEHRARKIGVDRPCAAAVPLGWRRRGAARLGNPDTTSLK